MLTVYGFYKISSNMNYKNFLENDNNQKVGRFCILQLAVYTYFSSIMVKQEFSAEGLFRDKNPRSALNILT